MAEQLPPEMTDGIEPPVTNPPDKLGKAMIPPPGQGPSALASASGFYLSRYGRHLEDLRHSLDLALRSEDGETSEIAADLALHMSRRLVDMVLNDFPSLSA